MPSAFPMLLFDSLRKIFNSFGPYANRIIVFFVYCALCKAVLAIQSYSHAHESCYVTKQIKLLKNYSCRKGISLNWVSFHLRSIPFNCLLAIFNVFLYGSTFVSRIANSIVSTICFSIWSNSFIFHKKMANTDTLTCPCKM